MASRTVTWVICGRCGLKHLVFADMPAPELCHPCESGFQSCNSCQRMIPTILDSRGRPKLYCSVCLIGGLEPVGWEWEERFCG